MPDPTDTPDLLPPAAVAPPSQPPLATLVTTDGVAVQLHLCDGAIELQPAGNRARMSFDRFQAIALRAALGLAS